MLTVVLFAEKQQSFGCYFIAYINLIYFKEYASLKLALKCVPIWCADISSYSIYACGILTGYAANVKNSGCIK